METFFFFFFFLVLLIPAYASPNLEQGYAISTVLNANKLASPIHPFSLLPSPSASHAFLLDSAASVFYTAPLPLAQGGGVRFLAGKGGAGYSDGDGPKALFGHPRSFAVDSGGNVYVADRSNHVIRKIVPSGVTTTIAGGYQRKAGKVDGPAQNATFSDDFELTFIPKMCVLLITDRGNSLVRQMKLKQDDCRQESSSGLGTASASLVAVVSVLFGCVIGFVSSPYIRSRTGNTQRSQNHPDMEALPNQHGDNTTDSLLRHQKLDSHGSSTNNHYVDQLKDLISVDGDVGMIESHSPQIEVKKENTPNKNVGKLEDMISSNLFSLVEPSAHWQGQLEMSSAGSEGVFKRKTSVSLL